MDTKNWESVKDLLLQAMRLSPEQRASFLDQACSSDSLLRSELESLIAASDDMRSSFMKSQELAGKFMNVIPGASLNSGQVFAQKFQLIRKLGEGGMGQVWLAEQTSPVRRPVAVKLIKAGMYDESVIQRFQSERQSLAIMDHPAIARVFDAGTTELGQPYFVMEYVPGLPITEYCDQKKLTINQRLELFIAVCEGVQHAHQKAIMHRDLKPANILIVEVDGKAMPRIIDFGLAKAVTSQGDAQTLFTQLGNLVGTPGFMSPEQVDSGAQDIDTRTDVYSLGAVLYVLLTGDLPLDTRNWQKQPLELLRRLREEDPPRPSTKVSIDRKSSIAKAEARGIEPGHLASSLRGDLDWIAMKALEKDRARRYGTPSEFAADIQRYLRHEPIAARPATAIYQLKKYIRRHRATVAAAALLLLLLSAFVALQAVQLRRTTQERDRASRERDRASRITDFMTNMFKIADPSESRGNKITAREILDKASADMTTSLSKDPQVQSDLLQVMARTYLNLGLYERAHELAQQALDARMKLFGSNDRRTLESMSFLGSVFDRQGHYPDAEKLENQALGGESILPPDDPLILETMDHLAVVVQDEGDYKQEESLERQVIAAATRTLGAENSQTLQATNNLGTSLWYQGRYAEAEQVYRHLLAVEERVFGRDHPETAKVIGNLALDLQSENRFAEAEQLYRQALEVRTRVLGPDHPIVANTLDNLAALLTIEGHLAEGEKLHRESLAIRLRTLGPEHDETLISQLNLADVLLREGRLKEAEALQRQTLATQLRSLGANNPDTLLSQSDLARTLTRERRYPEAEKLARETFEQQARLLGMQHPDALNTLQILGTALALSHRYSEAARLYQRVIENSKPEGQGQPWSVWYSFACVAAAANRPSDALKYLQDAIDKGYSDPDSLTSDDDLKPLRANPAFQKLALQLRQTLATTATH